MANFNYMLLPPHRDARRNLLKAQSHLLMNQKAVIYEDYPDRISTFKALRYANDIQQFFTNFLFKLEPINEVERWKLVEVKHHYYELEGIMNRHSKLILGLSTIYYTFRLKYDWIYKYKIKFIPSISRGEVFRRVAVLACGTSLTAYSKIWLTPWLIAFYYPELLCDAQIGRGFEMGYWTREFVQALK
jgi:hypothetical protein